MRRGPEHTPLTTFKRNFMNNQHIIRLLILLLTFSVIFLFTKIAYLFQPLGVFIQFFAFPMIGTVILYYLFSPIVVKLARRGVNRHLAIWMIYFFVTLLLVWGIATLVPIVQRQTQSFVENLPEYSNSIQDLFNSIPLVPDLEDVFPNLATQLSDMNLNGLVEQFQPIITSTFGSLGNVIGTLSTVVTGLITIPVLLYYMLLEGYKLIPLMLHHIPNAYRKTSKTIFFQSHYQIGRYVRGQIIVAIMVGFLFAIGFSIIGLDYAITLGVLATVLNVIPYIGSVMAAVPAVIIGLITSPFMFIKVLIVLSLEAFIEGRLIQPQILGSNLKIHPVTILIVLLGAGRLFGLTGVIVGVPAFAVFKVIFTELYRIYRKNSSLYEEDEITPQPFEEEIDIEESYDEIDISQVVDEKKG